MKNIFKSLYSAKTIYSLKDTKLYKSLFVLLFLSLLLIIGLASYFINLKQINATLFYKNIYQNVPENFPSDLPNCYINDELTLICENDTSYYANFHDFVFIINNEKIETYPENANIISFEKTGVNIINNGKIVYSFDYYYFKNTNFVDYKTLNSTKVIDEIASKIFLSIKPYIAFAIILYIYFAVVLINFSLILGFAAFVKTIKFNKLSLSYLQVLNIVIYAALLPTIITFLLINKYPTLAIILYNLLLIINFLYIYQSVIKKELNK